MMLHGHCRDVRVSIELKESAVPMSFGGQSTTGGFLSLGPAGSCFGRSARDTSLNGDSNQGHGNHGTAGWFFLCKRLIPCSQYLWFSHPKKLRDQFSLGYSSTHFFAVGVVVTCNCGLLQSSPRIHHYHWLLSIITTDIVTSHHQPL